VNGFYGVPDPAEDLSRAQLTANLRDFAMAWKHAHDRLGKGNGHGGYYVHDVMHHVGMLIEHAEAQYWGLDGLGCLSNSVLEHWHQVNGKLAFQGVHITSQTALACVARDAREPDSSCVRCPRPQARAGAVWA
jgi:hypothetical protein